MAQDARDTGELQVWANRQNVLPEIRAFAERNGVGVEERLRTGNTNLRPEDRSFQDFVNSLDKGLRAQATLNVVARMLKPEWGSISRSQAIRQLENDVANFGDTKGDWLRIGEHGSTLWAGGWFGTAGALQLARQIPVLANSARLISVTRWGGAGESREPFWQRASLIGQYLSGDLTDRQFWHGQATLGGAMAGGVFGGFVGFPAGGVNWWWNWFNFRASGHCYWCWNRRRHRCRWRRHWRRIRWCPFRRCLRRLRI